MQPPSFAEAVPNGTRLRVRVQPRASRNAIGEPVGDFLRIRVTAPPVDHAANEAVLDLLAQTLQTPRNSLRLVRGHSSRQKVIAVAGLTPDEVVARLGSS